MSQLFSSLGEVALRFARTLYALSYSGSPPLYGVAVAVAWTAALAILTYAVRSLYQPTVQSTIPAVVPQSQIKRAAAIGSQVSAIMTMIGPIAGGVLLGCFGIQFTVLAKTIGFAVSTLLKLFDFLWKLLVLCM